MPVTRIRKKFISAAIAGREVTTPIHPPRPGGLQGDETMTTMTTEITHLLAALDAGDDSVLPILADALEEAGDPRAAGLRRVGDRRPWALWDRWRWLWGALDAGLGAPVTPESLAAVLEKPIWDRLQGDRPGPEQGWSDSARFVEYDTASAALLALAEALANPLRGVAYVHDGGPAPFEGAQGPHW